MLTPPRRASLAAFAAAACALTAAAPSQAADPAFTSPPDVAFSPQSRPQGIGVGDFDSDGKQDFAIGDFTTDTVRIRLGNGDGTFQQADTIGPIGRPQAIAVGDLNSDGVEDLVVGGVVASNRDIAVLTGRGDGTFQLTGAIYTASSVSSLAIADFNGDGREDIAGASFSHVNVRLRDSNGQYVTGPDVAVPYPGALQAGDFDGNGTQDLAVTFNDTPPKLGILPGKGDGTFEQAKTTSIPNRARDLALGDFNGDGREDVAVSIQAENRVSIRLGNGDGTLNDDAPDVPVGSYPWGIAVGDLDADGREDLAVGYGPIVGDEPQGVSLRLGKGDGGFDNGGDVPTGKLPGWIAAGDVNADGREDLLIAQHTAGTVGVRLGVGDGPLAGNLLVNGGFEQGLGARLPSQSPAVPGWNVTGGMTFVRYGSVPTLGVSSWLDAPRYGGGLNYLSGGDSTGLNGVTTATQSVDVSGSAAGIDDGRATANLSAYLGGAQKYEDNMRVTASFLASDGSALGEFAVGPVSAEDRHNVTELLRRAAGAPVPAGTRTIRVVVTSTDTDTLSSATADNVKLALSVRDRDPVVVNDPPPPPPRQEFGADTRVTVGLAARRVAAGGPVRVRVANGNAFAVNGSLSGRTTVAVGTGRKRTAKLEAKRFSVAASGRTTVRLALPKAVRRVLKRKHELVVRFTARVTDPAGNERTVPKKVTLRLKPATRR